MSNQLVKCSRCGHMTRHGLIGYVHINPAVDKICSMLTERLNLLEQKAVAQKTEHENTIREISAIEESLACLDELA